MSGGTFNVSRSIWTHPVFAPSEFSEREAFLWMVSEASWKPRTVRAGRIVVDLERGQLCASVRFMADAWRWSKSRTSRFVEKLKKRDMIGTDCGTGQLIITICNYDKFQGDWDSRGTVAGHEPGHERDTSGTNENKDKEGLKKETFNAPARAGDFDRFWSLYPDKTGKQAAKKKFDAAVKSGVDPDRIMAGLERYLQTDRVRRGFIKAPTTWLNQGCWDDQPALAVHGGDNGEGNLTRGEQAAERRVRALFSAAQRVDGYD